MIEIIRDYEPNPKNKKLKNIKSDNEDKLYLLKMLNDNYDKGELENMIRDNPRTQPERIYFEWIKGKCVVKDCTSRIIKNYMNEKGEIK